MDSTCFFNVIETLELNPRVPTSNMSKKGELRLTNG